MKKTLLTLALVASAASSVFAQGFVLFNNTVAAATHVSTNNLSTTGLAGAASGDFYYALFYSASATLVNGSSSSIAGPGNYVWNDSNWHFGNAYATTTTSGRLSSTSSDPNNSGGTPVTGVPLGGTAEFVVVGWSAQIGTTVAALEAWYADPIGNYLVGESIVSGPIVTSAGGQTFPPPIFGSSTGLLQGFTLAPVPEPTTIALIGIGGLGLAMIRRRK
jgi:hypothetical protein